MHRGPLRLALCLSALGLPLLVAGCGDEAAPSGESRAPLVEAVQAGFGALPLQEEVNGVVRAENQVAVRPEIAAPIAEVFVRSGAAVEAGQPLVRLRDDELREDLRRAEAEVRLAEASAAQARAVVAELEARVERTRRLAAERLVSAQLLDTQEAELVAARASERASEARVEQARAGVEAWRATLAKTLVRAPVSGRLGERNAEIGMLADPGTVLFRVGNLRRVIVELPLTEEMLARVGEGDPVLIRPRTPGLEPIPASLSRVSPFLEEESFTTEAEIDVDNSAGHLRPGMFVSVTILYGRSRDATLVPTSALWEDPRTGERGVFVVEESEGLGEIDPAAAATSKSPERERAVRFRRVGVLAEGRGSLGVEGVSEGEWVVTVGQHLLRRRMRDDPGARDGDATTARIRPATWERVAALQELQREDLLAGFLDKQRRVARALGAAIPESESVVDEALRAGAEDGGPPAPGGGER